MAASDWEDEWELCNDDGFVYKRKKRRLDEPSISAPPPPDPHAEERNRAARRRATLLRLRDKYETEIRQWELVSNRLRAMELKSQQESQQQKQQERDEEEPGSSSLPSSSASPLRIEGSEEDPARRSLVDELLLQAEAHDAVMSDISNLCDIVETMCDAQEERTKQHFFDLPIWGSPRELMRALCDD